MNADYLERSEDEETGTRTKENKCEPKIYSAFVNTNLVQIYKNCGTFF